MNCGNAVSYAPDCSNPTSQGVKDKIWIIDHDQWQKATKTRTGNVISAIVLPILISAKTGEVNSGGHKVRFSGVLNDAKRTLYTHELDSYISNVGEDGKTAADEFGNGRYVVIAQLSGDPDEDQFQILGDKNGLKMHDVKFDSTAMGGTITGTFKTMDGEFEPKLPLNFWDTDLVTTIEALEALEIAIPS